jgi:hypothetical protein
MRLEAQNKDEKIEITATSDRVWVPERELDACDYLNGGLGTRDFDADGVENCVDNCIFDPNKNQKDKDKDGIGDACEARKRADEWWDKVGQNQRRTATEPVDLKRLVNRSSEIVLATRTEGIFPDPPNSLGGWIRIKVVKQFKGASLPKYPTIDGVVWVYIPDGGPQELMGELLYFLDKGRLRAWPTPQVYGSNQVSSQPYVETHYFAHRFTDRKYGVLGVSPERLRLIEQIVLQEKRLRKK